MKLELPGGVDVEIKAFGKLGARVMEGHSRQEAGDTQIFRKTERPCRSPSSKRARAWWGAAHDRSRRLEAVQLGLVEARPPRRVTKPQQGHFRRRA